MICFAANSLLCRMALKIPENDPVSFTLIRLISAALMLSFFFIKNKTVNRADFTKISLLAPISLFSYTIFFSLSYVQIGAGTGALILFACVQLTMVAFAVIRGQKLNAKEKIGFLIASIGFIYLLLPGLHRPSLISAIFMILSGISWGIYSLIGATEKDPVFATARNFIFTVPVVILLIILKPLKLNADGYILAVLSGAISSGLGYVIWYKVLKQLKTSTAAIIQLSVPALAALGGALFLDEALTLRLVIASAVICAGIFIKIKFSKAELMRTSK